MLKPLISFQNSKEVYSDHLANVLIVFIEEKIWEILTLAFSLTSLRWKEFNTQLNIRNWKRFSYDIDFLMNFLMNFFLSTIASFALFNSASLSSEGNSIISLDYVLSSCILLISFLTYGRVCVYVLYVGFLNITVNSECVWFATCFFSLTICLGGNCT